MKLLTLLIISSSFLFMACEEDQDKVFAAQECLDNLSTTATTEALACYNMVAGVGGQQAAIVRCGAKLIEGGLTDSKFATAFQHAEDNKGSASVEAELIALLALDSLPISKVAVVECDNSAMGGLIFLAGLSYTGTEIKSMPGFDPNNPGPAISACVAAGNPNNCNLTAIAGSVDSIASTYCSGESADQEVCNDVKAAQAAGTVSESFLCLVQGKTFSAGACI